MKGSRLKVWARLVATLLIAVCLFPLTQNFSPAGPKSNFFFISTYLQPGHSYPDQNYVPEFAGDGTPGNRVTAVHMNPALFNQVKGYLGYTRAILDVQEVWWDWNRKAIDPNARQKIDRLGRQMIDQNKDKIWALYLVDEPTNQGITRQHLETVIRLFRERSPDLPTYVVWAHDCFDPNPALDAKCGMPGWQRGIPGGLHWIGFDWYLDNNDISQDAAEFNRKIRQTVYKIKSMSQLPIVLVNDGTNQFLHQYNPAFQDEFLTQRFYLFKALAESEPQVIGIDNYAWADHYEFGRYIMGTRNFPKLRSHLFAAANIFAQAEARVRESYWQAFGTNMSIAQAYGPQRLDGWVQAAIRDNLNVGQIVAAHAAFLRANRSAVAENVTRSYYSALGYAPTATQLAGWSSGPTVLFRDLVNAHRGFLSSNAAARRQVIILSYQRAFGRSPNQAEINAWMAAPVRTFDELVAAHLRR